MADVRIIGRDDSVRIFVDGTELRHARAFALSFDADQQRRPRLLVEFIADEIAIEASNTDVVLEPSTPLPRG